jgi:hypothetical protein
VAIQKVTQSAANAVKGSAVYELARIVNQLQAAVAELKADFNAHTHRADGAQAAAYNTSTPQSDAQTLAPVTASQITATTPDTIEFNETGAPS